MEDKDILWHINWGDGDTTFVIAPDKETAIKQMGDGKDMVNSIVGLHAIYSIIKGRGHRAGIREVAEYLQRHFLNVNELQIDGKWLPNEKWQAKLKEWGL